MNTINYDITLHQSPYYEGLVEELHNIASQKRNLYREIRNERDYHTKLSYEQRGILKHISQREDEILLEILHHKGWLENKEISRSLTQSATKLLSDEEDFDEYRVNVY